MLEGTLGQQRYDIGKSLHLKTVFSGREALFEQWKKGAVVQLENFLSSPSGKDKKQGPTKYDRWTLVDTDDTQDLFLCGTEVKGSCQTIDGIPERNKCLMAYVIDGKNRLLAIKDHSGRIIARHILRILWDGNQPVLMLERLYPTVVAAELQEALKSFAQQRAGELGLPLLNIGDGTGTPYPHSIESLGSNAPFEYCHSSTGMTTGIFKIIVAYRCDPSLVSQTEAD
jgi:hypothetical protein